MPRRRLPKMMQPLRQILWERSGGLCQYPYRSHPVPLEEAHVDRIGSGSNALSNFRTLCRFHKILRAASLDQQLVARALADGIIPPNWRELVWSDPVEPPAPSDFLPPRNEDPACPLTDTASERGSRTRTRRVR
jgi:5-methylcytosine-specific restriction protein A